MTTRIYQRNGSTRIRLDAVRNPDGSFTLSGYDLGAAPLKTYGRDELDYELEIPSNAMPAAFIAILQALLATSETPITTLRAALDSNNVAHTFRVLP